MVLPNKKLRGNSQNWLNYQSTLSITTCSECKSRHGKIVSSDDKMAQSTLLLHLFCQCLLLPMRTLIAGTATNLSLNGADYYLMFYGTLPKYYITKFPFVNTFPSDFRDIFYFALFYEIISLFFLFLFIDKS